MRPTATRRHFLQLILTAAAAFIGLPRRAAQAEAARDGVDTVGSVVILAPVNVSVVRKGKVRAIMTLIPNLDIADAAIRERVAREVPRVRDAYLRTLDPYVDRMDLRSAPDIARLTELLQRATDGLYGGGSATVLIIHATMRRVA